jgi:hypothetical protein
VSRADADILRAARKRIEDPAHWTKGTFARDSDGFAVKVESPRAVCFCAIGAVYAAFGKGDIVGARDYLDGAAGMRVVVDINDHGTHADVLALFDRAIALAEREAFHAP